MGDRWYESQKKSKYTMNKEPRKLKKDYILDINKVLKTELNGLDKCTIATLDKLLNAIKATGDDNVKKIYI